MSDSGIRVFQIQFEAIRYLHHPQLRCCSLSRSALFQAEGFALFSFGGALLAVQVKKSSEAKNVAAQQFDQIPFIKVSPMIGYPFFTVCNKLIENIVLHLNEKLCSVDKNL